MIQPLDEFIADAMAFFAALPPTKYADALPCGYLCGWRSWDVWNIMQWADFQSDDVLLDCGAFQTFAALYFSQFVGVVSATDSFYWEQRDFIKEQNLPSSADWMLTVRELGHKKVIPYPMDLQAIDQPDGMYDKITCISTIEHVLDDHKAMSEMLRVLKPDGRLLLTTEFDEVRSKDYSESDGSWYRVYNRETWNALLAPYKVLYQCVSDQPHQHWFTVAFAVIVKE